ncbi:MAG: bifunctional phosphopantothenoylcysteine decarboxylase/phosphopantothenate--cysteine ligase CoaBC [Acidimicrobiia bacterium]
MDPRLAHRRIVLGVSGGIAAYKAVELLRVLMDAGAYVMPVLTADAQRFVGALTFSALASEPARTALFDANEPIPHTRLGQRADLVVVAPATANLIAKYAHGQSDDLMTATLLATRAPVVIAPAMHTEMWEHASVRDNLSALERRGVTIVPPETGRLAGGDVGAGRLASPETIVAACAEVLAERCDLAGTRVLVTAGGTREPIDPVRFIGNRSSGKQGHAIAIAAARRGAAVTLVTTTPFAVDASLEVVMVETAAEMEREVVARYTDADIVVMAAAVADFRPKVTLAEKIKKTDGTPDIVLEPTPDILAELGARKAHQFVVGFAAETTDLIANAQRKLAAKGCDLVVANDVTADDAGFGVDTNRVVVLVPGVAPDAWPVMSKAELADRLLDRITAMRSGR